MKKLVIFGRGNFAAMAHYLFTHDSPYDVIAFCIDAEYYAKDGKASEYLALPIITTQQFLDFYPPEQYELFIAVGIQSINQRRTEIVEEFIQRGYTLPSYVSSSASVPAGFSLSYNTMIMDHVIIHPYVSIGANTIIWTRSTIGLNSKIGKNCWLVKADLGESTHIGNNCFLGINATVAPNIEIGHHSVLGISSTTTQSIPPYSVMSLGSKRPSKASSLKIAHRLT